MKKMTTKQKLRWNKLSNSRRSREMKRRPYVEGLIKAQRKINLANRQQAAYRAKYQK